MHASSVSEQVNTSNTTFLTISRTPPPGAVPIRWPSTLDVILAFDARRSTFDRPRFGAGLSGPPCFQSKI